MTVSISVVSHGHGDHVLALLDSLVFSGLLSAVGDCELLLTLNVPEPVLKQRVEQCSWPFRLVWIENAAPLGFGANHNQAFTHAKGDVFAVVNPDIEFLPIPDGCVRMFENNTHPDGVGMWVPRQVDRSAHLQDHCRRLLTPWGVFARTVLRMVKARHLTGAEEGVAQADWVNGACLFFPREVYRALGGFDERYFMYCEDADICLRLQLTGLRMQAAPFTVLHDAQRNSLRPGKHLRWHLVSLIRFWSSATFWRYWFRSWLQSGRDSSALS